ncbi:MAG TPA: TIGR00282 family metallophosphoesterase [Dehalococcoidia bacterium]|nr:TIGR00282 family metallophosphoesterase [Dehalococcoidia bacterium]
MRILMIGDVVGKPGRRAVNQLLPGLRYEYGLDLVVANGENAAGGLGITLVTAQELLNFGVDVITTGNHVWAQKEIIPYLDGELPILRPLNFPPGAPGRGFLLTRHALIVNLMGRVFMGESDCPFRAMDCLLSEIKTESKVIIVDFHAEATSEKVAMGRYLDGRVSAVLGTHTHVGTIDACILPKGTAYVTDVGMVGPVDSVIGDDAESVIHSFLTKMPHRISIGKGRVILNAVLVEVDEASGRAASIQRIQQEEEQ